MNKIKTVGDLKIFLNSSDSKDDRPLFVKVDDQFLKVTEVGVLKQINDKGHHALFLEVTKEQ